MSEQMNTSAKRILRLIKHLDSVQGESVYHRYSNAFETKDYDTVHELIKRSKQLVSQYTTDIKDLDYGELCAPPISALLKLFATHQINSSYSGLRNQITPDLMKSLEFADHGLTQKGREKELSQDVIREITETVNELERLVLESDLPPELKHVLNEYVVLFRKALTEYQIIGIEAFKDAFGDSIKIAVKNAETLNKPEAQEATKWVNKLMVYARSAANFTFEHWDVIKDVSTFLLGSGE